MNPAQELIRVPLLHNNFHPDRSGVHAPDVPDFKAVFRPEISTSAADSTHIDAPSPMADMHDNNAAPVTHNEVITEAANRVTDMLQRPRQSSQGNQSTLKKLWNGVLDDVFGQKKGGAVT